MTIFRTFSAVVLLVVTSLTATAFGQANNGRLTGTVLDPSGAVLPGALVTLRNLGTNASTEITTDAEGRFAFPEQPIGRYQLTVALEGFQTAVLSDVTLLTGQLLDLKVPLQVGDISSSVDVTGGVPLVQSGTSSVQTSMTERQVQELPLNGRNPLQLVALTAGATITDAGTVAGQQDNRGISVNGLRTTQNNFRLDGSNYTNRFFGSAPILPNPDTLQEFTVQSANYSARTAGAGALVELSTRSGTNDFHGSGFEFLRDTSLNANNFFINARPLTAAQLAAGVTEQPKPPFKLNQYGGTLGGPIVKSRAFFFGSYQGTRQRSSPSSVTIQSLTTAQRNGDFSSIATPIIDPRTGTQFVTNGVANVIPADRLDPTVRRVLDTYLPLPDSGNNLLVIQDRDVDDDQYTGKVDLVSGRNYLSARYSDDDNDFQRPFTAPTGFYAANNFRNRSLSVRDTYTLTSNLLVTVSGAYSKFRRIQEPQAPGLQTLQSFGVNAPQTIDTSFFPGVRFMANPAFQLFSGGGLEQTPSSSDFHGTAVWTRGAHVLQFGSDVQFDRLYTLDASFTPGTWTFNGQRTGVLLADVVLGLPSQFQQDSGRTNDLRESKYHFWIQDDWKVRPRLTLNLGLRWEPKLPPIDKLNNLVGFVRGAAVDRRAQRARRGWSIPATRGSGRKCSRATTTTSRRDVGFAVGRPGHGKDDRPRRVWRVLHRPGADALHAHGQHPAERDHGHDREPPELRRSVCRRRRRQSVPAPARAAERVRDLSVRASGQRRRARSECGDRLLAELEPDRRAAAVVQGRGVGRLRRQPRGEDPRAEAAESRGLRPGRDAGDDQRPPDLSRARRRRDRHALSVVQLSRAAAERHQPRVQRADAARELRVVQDHRQRVGHGRRQHQLDPQQQRRPA